MPQSSSLGDVVNAVEPEVSSIGMNAGEFRSLTDAWNIARPDQPIDIVTRLDTN